MPVRLQDVVGGPAVGRRPVIVELQLAEGIQLPLPIGWSRDVPHGHSGGVDRHHKVSGVLHCVGLPAEDVSDLEKGRTNTF